MQNENLASDDRQYANVSVVSCYAFPVLWSTSCVLIMARHWRLTSGNIGNEVWCLYTGWAKNVRPQTHVYNSVKSLPIYTFFTGRYLGKLAVNWLLKIKSLVAHGVTLQANIWQSYNRERGCLVHFVRLATTPRRKCMPDLNSFHWQTQQ